MFDVTLSFDNGPEPNVTGQVLDVLAERDILTTFFVIGEKLGDGTRRVLAERAQAEGHWIGNHTFTHTSPFGDSADPTLAEREIERTQGALGQLAHPDRFFRPYAGGGGLLSPRLLSPAAVAYLTRGAYTCVLWNAVPHDWDDVDGWVDRALAQCQAQAWTLLVLHDLPTGAMRHLPRFLDRLSGMGGRLRQDFPPSCVPILRGNIVLPLEGFVSRL